MKTPKYFCQRIVDTNAPAAVLLVRMAVGAIFFSEGIQKFLFPAALGVGRFAKIGLPSPEVLAPFVGSFEIVCGLLVLFGLATRLASIPLVAIMLTAIASTKFPILLKHGFWAMAHESRADYAMLLSALFLMIAGSGPISIDRHFCDAKRH